MRGVRPPADPHREAREPRDRRRGCAGRARRPFRRIATAILAFLTQGIILLGFIGPLLSLALDPEWRMLALALAAPILLVPLTMAGVFLWSLGSSVRELRELVRDRGTRVVHGLEHATAKLLEDDGHVVHGGLTHLRFFELHLDNTGNASQQTRAVQKAVRAAIRRVRAGESHLAYHPQCGTSMLVGATLVSLLALGSGSSDSR